MKIDENDPVYETFVSWTDAAFSYGDRDDETDDTAVQDLLDYMVDMLGELEDMAEQKQLNELAGSLSLCKNLARLSGRRR